MSAINQCENKTSTCKYQQILADLASTIYNRMSKMDIETKNALFCISSIDGRYSKTTQELRSFFSEAAYITYRANVMVFQFVHNCSRAKQDITDAEMNLIVNKLNSFGVSDLISIKILELSNEHDLKAIEVFMSDWLAKNNMKHLCPFMHIFSTSEDVTSCAIGKMCQDYKQFVLERDINKLILHLQLMAKEYASVPMLAKTHGQNATPVTFGQSMAVYVARLKKAYKNIANIKFAAKMNGATGGYNAHTVICPDVDWREHSRIFVEDIMGLDMTTNTTQIQDNDTLAHFLYNTSVIAGVVLDLDIFMWLLAMRGLLKYTIKKGQVGSSTMPHKINPIDFENSEGNCRLFLNNALGLSRDIQLSRLQRDLSVNTELRTLGTTLGYLSIAFTSVLKGLSKVTPDIGAMSAELENAYEVLVEALNHALRFSNRNSNAYNIIKDETQGKKINRDTYVELVKMIKIIDPVLEERLLNMTPLTYIGLGESLAREC